MSPGTRTHVRRLAAWTLFAIALAMVFAAYLDPHFALDLASRVWACF